LIAFAKTTTAVSLSAVLLAGANAWRPAPRPLRSEWCEANVRLPAETGAQPGKFDVDDGHAYLREIIDAVDDPEVSKITFVGCTQIGKTETTRAIVLSQGEVARAPMMFAGPDQVYAREQRDLIYSLRNRSGGTRSRSGSATIGRSTWRSAWSTSPGRGASSGCRAARAVSC